MFPGPVFSHLLCKMEVLGGTWGKGLGKAGSIQHSLADSLFMPVTGKVPRPPRSHPLVYLSRQKINPQKLLGQRREHYPEAVSQRGALRSRFSSVSPYFIYIYIFCLFGATPAAYGGSQARDRIGAAAASLHHSHSHTRSEQCL